MADLRAVFEGVGFSDVQTYIQSGNVVFSSERTADLESLISEAIKRNYAWDVPVLVKTAPEIEAIVATCPFSKERKEKSYFAILNTEPATERISETALITYPGEVFVITKKCVYIYSERRAADSKLSNNFFERKLKVAATTRNFRTLTKLVDIAAG